MGQRILSAGLLASLITISPSVAQTQGRAMMAGGARPMAAAPSAVAHAAPPLSAPVMPGARMIVRTSAPHPRTTIIRSTGQPIGARRHVVADGRVHKPGCSTVPGLGFDVPHLAAVCGPGAVGAGRIGNQFPFFFPFSGGEIFIPSPTVVGEQVDAAEQQAEEVEPQVDVPETPRRARVSRPVQTAEVEPATAAPRQSEEYVFVRRDGTLFFAVAYAWENGTLRYITSEGMRRSLARDALDLDATQQFNEQRGMNFHSPA